MTTPKQVVRLSRGVARHAEKLPTKSQEVSIRSEWRGIVGVKRGKGIMNIVLKFNERGDYDGTWCNSTSKECKQTRENLKLIGEVGKL